jgi:hypothetical protein
VLSLPEFIGKFLDKPFFREEDLSDEQLAQRAELKINEAEATGRADERFALKLLPLLFHINGRFFLQQPWVIELLAEWHNKGEEDLMYQAFFVPRKRGHTPYEEVRFLVERDEKFAAAVRWLMENKGLSCRRAIAEVASNAWMVVGKNNVKGTSTVSEAYENSRKTVNPRLIKHFS